MNLNFDILNEGLRKDDLKELVESVISIDEYVSKVGKDAIVVAFYVEDSEPADDLSAFIESGSTEVIDTEVSSSTNEHGKYAVFVEFLRNEDFPKTLLEVVNTLDSLTGITDWMFTYYDSNDTLLGLSEENITNVVRLETKIDPIDVKENMNYFVNSDIEDLNVDETNIAFRKGTNVIVYEHIGIGEPSHVMKIFDLEDKPLDFSNEALRECKVIRNMLGYNWDVNKIDNHFIVANDTDTRIVILK